jgi:tetratricopeptide (TPR) repeat protein
MEEGLSVARPLRLSLLPVLCSLALLCGLLLLGGCELGPSMFIAGRDREIKNATQDIESARNDNQRAKAYSTRGVAYSEKARYSREFKLITDDEYERLFDLSVKDHDQAVALNPGSAELYFNRGQAYYDRGGSDLMEHKDGKRWFDLAAADFAKATEKDATDYLAFDRLGLAHEANGESDKAIRDYTQEMALNPLGRARLADAYCERGMRLLQQKNYNAAVVEYRKSVDVGATPDDGCSCEPYNPLVAIYATEIRQYDKAWEAVHLAAKSKRHIYGEVVDRLRKDSGRTE